MVNRDLVASGYWDYPMLWINPEDANVLHPICFFDFDVLGWRRLEYFRVRIVRCPAHPETEGRDALVDVANVDTEWIANDELA